jgi:hypothetical protein
MFSFFLRGVILIAIVLPIGFTAYAQSYAESALLFSRTQPTGSARIQALGGTQVALGGDYSSALSNPAGLGMFNRSEFTFTPALNFYNTSTNYLGSPAEESSSKLNIPGLSYVLHLPSQKEGDYIGGSFGLSMSRSNDFNRTTVYGGRNETNSIVDYFLEQANGDIPAQFDEYQFNTPTGLAYDNYLIGPQSILDPPGPDDQYFTDAPIESDQQEEIITKGTTYQWSFSYGGNYKDVLFFGGGLGVSSLRYKSQKIFAEQYDSEIIDNLELTENLNIRGSGINATLGVLARPVEFLQIGVSYTTPTYYQITEKYDASMSTRWNNFDYWNGEENITLNNESASTDIVISEYNLTLPSKLSAGLAFITKYGFLTGDVEMTNPSKARYSSDIEGISFSPENNTIKSLYQATVNYRIGAEFRYEIFRVRAGYNVQSNAYENSNIDNKISSISGGAGVRFEKFYIDFAVVNRKSDTLYSPYTLSDGPEPVSIKNKTTMGMITLGFTF